MALVSVLRANSLRERLVSGWRAFLQTTIGDIFATAVAIGGMSALFLAAAFAVMGLGRAAHFVLRILGAG